jgi:hypothetical protein
MPDLRNMWTTVSLQTNVRTVHKLYEALLGIKNGRIVSLGDDANLRDFFALCEGILLQSNYMTPAEVRALREPLHGVWEVKG